MMLMLLLLGVVLLLILLSGFFSGIETGVWRLNRVRLRVRVEKRDPRALRLARLVERPEEVVIASVLGNNSVDYLFTVTLSMLLAHAGIGASMPELYVTAIGTPVLLVWGSILPKSWFNRQADRLMSALVTPISICVAVARGSGMLWALRALPRAMIRAIDPSRVAEADEPPPRVRVQNLLQEGATQGGLSAFQKDTLQRILEVSHVRLAKVMVPLARAARVPVDIRREDFLRIARMAHFSRLPVHGSDPRKMVGIVSVFDVLADPQQRPVSAHVRPALFLQMSDTVPVALARLQQSRQFMALVTDRQGQCVGLLTMKDLVEEIVGDLEVW